MDAAHRQKMENAHKWIAFRRHSVALLVVIGGVWAILVGTYAMLPYLRPGAEIVYAAKTEVVRAGTLFRREAAVKVAVFGNSKVLSGFKPEQFDGLSRGRVSSYNLGLPNYLLFVENLAFLCQRGEAPTHAFIMFPWSDAPPKVPTLFKPEIDDDAVMDFIFPFRRLPRDVVIFAIGARSRGGLSARYQHGRRQVQSMLNEKGYYFIEGQSHFPNHRLPDGFRLQSDDPKRENRRKVSVDVPVFAQLIAVLDRCSVHAFLIPAYYREGEYAPPASVSEAAQSLAPYPRIAALVPDYWLLPNRYFADPVHLNPAGAERYTQMLWELTQPLLFPRTQDAGDVVPVSSLSAAL